MHPGWADMFFALILVALQAAAVPIATAQQAGAGDATALTVLGEIALERGDCKGAAESYAAAAPKGSVELAKRASEVGLACEHLPAAWQSAQRWRALAPNDIDAAAIYAAIALKLYHIPEAQGAVRTVVRSGEADAKLAELATLLLDDAEAPAVLAAISGAIDTDKASVATLDLLAELAIDAHDLHRAQQYARLALKQNRADYAANSLLARAYAEEGNTTEALTAARAAMQADPKRGTFELVEVLALLDRIDDTRKELERLRAAGSSSAEIDRRLALLALQAGDLDDAQRRFALLTVQPDANEASLFYLSDIAALKGDSETALAGFRRLTDSTLAVAARTRAAGLLLDRGSRAEALTLLDGYVTEHPERGFDMTLTKANLLSEHGEADAGLAILSFAMVQHPRHPALEYDRAMLLEKQGEVRESIAVLERLLSERPGDSNLLNALGYTLTEHGLRLSHAEQLIRQALTVTPDNAAVIDSLGWVRFKRGDARGAATILERAYRLGRDSEIAAHWGEALWKSGARAEARKAWATALEHDPHSKSLQTVIGRYVPPAKP